VASDAESSAADAPYVPYTVNRPIGGDSPKRRAPANASTVASRLRLGGNAGPSRQPVARGTMVVVNTGESRQMRERPQEDPELAHLRSIPSFLPIMRGSLSGSAAKDPDILERLDHRGLLSMAERYQGCLRRNAAVVAGDQQRLNKDIRAVERRIAVANQGLSDRQRELAKAADRLASASEISKTLTRCHVLLNENIDMIETLNNMLPQEDRLEPFVWTTG